jgi:hypothetical protein
MKSVVHGIAALLAACAGNESVAPVDSNDSSETKAMASFIGLVLTPALVIADRIETDEWPSSDRIHELLRQADIDAGICSLDVVESTADNYRFQYRVTNPNGGGCSEAFEARATGVDGSEECFEYFLQRAGNATGSELAPLLVDRICAGEHSTISVPLNSLLLAALPVSADISEEATEQLRQRLNAFTADGSAGEPR